MVINIVINNDLQELPKKAILKKNQSLLIYNIHLAILIVKTLKYIHITHKIFVK